MHITKKMSHKSLLLFLAGIAAGAALLVSMTLAIGCPITITGVSDGPDPFKATGTTNNTIRYTLSGPCRLSLRIIDTTGTAVRMLFDASTTAGSKSAAWNGKDDSGTIVPDGLYTYRIDTTSTSGDTLSAEGTITVDKTAPTVTGVSSVPNPLTSANTVTTSYTVSEPVKTTISIYTAGNALVKTLRSNVAETAGAHSVDWNGKNSSGTLVGDGTYLCKIKAVDYVGLSSTVVDTLTVERSTPTITGVSDSPDPFKATGSNTNRIRYTLSETVRLSLRLVDSTGTAVRTLVDATQTAGTKSSAWNGKDDSGTLVADGVYNYYIDATDTAGTVASTVGTITVDRTAPAITGVAALPNPLTSASTVTVSYTLSEPVKTTVGIYTSSNSLVRMLKTNQAEATGAHAVDWDGKTTKGALVGDGTYLCKITAVDYVSLASTAVNTLTVDRSTPTITGVSDSPDPFKATGTSTNLIRYSISETVRLSLKILDSTGTAVRTLVDVTTTAGTKSSAWNGKDDSATLVPDGTYSYHIDVTDTAGIAGSVIGTITVDKTAPTVTGVLSAPNPLSSVATVTTSYTVSEPVKTTISIYTAGNALVKTLRSNVAETIGAHSADWNGKTTSGALVADGTYLAKITAVDYVGFSSTVVDTLTVERSTPTITGVSDSPDPFKATGSNTNLVRYTLSEPVRLSLRLVDSTGTVVRTLVDATTTAGSKSSAWNGKDDSGTLVPDGVYTYYIDATDTAGTAASTVGTITVDRTAPIISANSVSPDPFHPTGSNTMTVSYTLSEPCKVTVAIYSSSNTLIKTLCSNVSLPTGANSITWNGRNSANVLITTPDTYIYKITAVDGVGLTAQLPGVFTTN